jgi:hypothetical protein
MTDDGTQIDKFAESQEPRRSFLRRAAFTVLGAAAGVIGLQSPASATYHVDCCYLAYNVWCTSSQWNNCTNRWSWTCCAYVGSQLTRVSCRECYSAHCSNVAYISGC